LDDLTNLNQIVSDSAVTHISRGINVGQFCS